MGTVDIPQKTIRRLKADGLVPKDQAIRLVFHRKRDSKVKWEAVNAITGEQYKVGGTAGTMVMWNHEWTRDTGDDGWVILIPGERLPPAPVGGMNVRLNQKGFGKRYPQRYPRTLWQS